MAEKTPGMEIARSDESSELPIEKIFLNDALTPEQAQRAFQATCTYMEAMLPLYTTEIVDRFEHIYQEHGEYPDEDKDLYTTYSSLREKFNQTEFSDLAKAARSHTIEVWLKQRLAKEYEYVSQREQLSKDNIQKARDAIHGYFEDMRIEYPRENDAPVRFFGRYTGLVLGTNNARRPVPWDAGGWAPAGTDVALVQVDGSAETSQKPFSETELITLIHECIHTLGNVYGQPPQEYIPFDENSLRKLRSGFTRAYSHGEQPIFGNINEGTTELFAREIAQRLGWEDAAPAYDEPVMSMVTLMEYLKERENDTVVDQEQTLLREYVSSGGLLQLKRTLEKHIGPQSLALCEALAFSPNILQKFLHLVEKMQQNSLHESDICELSVERFIRSNPPINPKKAMIDFPFLRLITHEKNPVTGEYEKKLYVA